MQEHRKGRGGKYTKQFILRGIGFTLAKTWPISSREEEHKRKKQGHLVRLCPICAGRLPLVERPHYVAEFAGLTDRAAIDFPDEEQPF